MLMQLAQGAKQAADVQSREAKRGADAATQAAKRATDAQIREDKRASAQRTSTLKSALQIGAGAAGVNFGLSAIHQGITALQGFGEAAQKTTALQNQLNQSFGAGTVQLRSFT